MSVFKKIAEEIKAPGKTIKEEDTEVYYGLGAAMIAGAAQYFQTGPSRRKRKRNSKFNYGSKYFNQK